jgi:crotonobetainyl-CoA:carnitine CoA-transferase CaiB-like acyl-CoA transferase
MILSFLGADVVKVERPDGEIIRGQTPASETPAVTDSPHVGEHTEEMLSEVAGYSAEQLAELRERDAL